jgi:hypothetical protein
MMMMMMMTVYVPTSLRTPIVNLSDKIFLISLYDWKNI